MQFTFVIFVIFFVVLETTGTSSRDSSRSPVSVLKDKQQQYKTLAGESAPGPLKRLEDRMNLRSRRTTNYANSSLTRAELNATSEYESKTNSSNNSADSVLEQEPSSASYKDPFHATSALVKVEDGVRSGGVIPVLLTKVLHQSSDQNVSEADTRSKVYDEKVMIEDDHLEITKSLNRPPWLGSKFHQKNQSENETRGHSTSNPAPTVVVLVGDDPGNKRNSSTWSYQNSTSILESDGVSGNISKTSEAGGSKTHEILPSTTRLVQGTTFATKSTPETKDKRRRIYPNKVKYTSPSKVTRKDKTIREKLKQQTHTESSSKHVDKDGTDLPTTAHTPYTDSDIDDVKTSSVDNVEYNGDCPTCGNQKMTEEEVKELRLDMFTDLLLQKLRMSPEDLVEGGRGAENPIPKLPVEVFEQTFKDKSWDDAPDDFYARDEEIIITGVDMGRECIKTDSTGCYSFDLQDKVKSAGIASAHLWLYKAKDRADVSGQTFIVYELGFARSGLLQEKSQIARKELETMEDWININMTRYVTSWLEKRTTKQMLAIRCKTCSTRNYRALYGAKYGYKPILVIKYLNRHHDERKKRTASCDPRTECCKRPLIANFEAINMHNILQPKNLSVGFCYGYCDGIDQFTYNHTSIKQRIRWQHNIDSSMREQLKPCCVPLILKDTFIITNEDGYMVRKILPKVIVEKCGCM